MIRAERQNVVYIASKIQRGHDYCDFVCVLGSLRCNNLPLPLEKTAWPAPDHCIKIAQVWQALGLITHLCMQAAPGVLAAPCSVSPVSIVSSL